jgi:hypothetical protein
MEEVVVEAVVESAGEAVVEDVPSNDARIRALCALSEIEALKEGRVNGFKYEEIQKLAVHLNMSKSKTRAVLVMAIRNFKANSERCVHTYSGRL